MKVRKILAAALAVLLMLAAAAAGAEYARVETPKGPLKMRAGQSTKKKVICEIPNGTVVELEECGETWSQVTYNDKSGWVKTEYLYIPSQHQEDDVTLSLSPENPSSGQILELSAQAEDAVSYQWELSVGGTLQRGDEESFSTVCCRPVGSGLSAVKVTARFSDGTTSTAEIFFDLAEADSSATEDVYSQRDGSWKKVRYGSSNLADSGCAIFALAHGLRLMGFSGEEITPSVLAKTFSYCLRNGGTVTETMMNGAAKLFGFKTQEKLIKKASTLREKFEEGALFTFAVVKGHIALAAELEGDMVLVYDSCPSVTLERLTSGGIYIRNDDGTFTPVTDLAQVPGAHYFFATGNYGGLCYYMPLDYLASRGGRLMMPKK